MKRAFFTMDVESFYDTECLKNTTYMVYDDYSGEEGVEEYTKLLDKYKIKATFFTLLSSLDKAKPHLLTAIQNGHEIALHGKDHSSPLDMKDIDFEAMILEGKNTLEKELKTEVKGYRAPCFGIKENQLNILRRNGFLYDSSALNFHLAMKSGEINLKEYKKIGSNCYYKDGLYEITPNQTKTIIGTLPMSGGGYARLLPWFFVKHYIKKAIKQADTYMFYVHPYEIIDKNPKIAGLDFVDRHFIKIGRKRYLKKIEYIINYLKKKGFVFQTLSEVQLDLHESMD